MANDGTAIVLFNLFLSLYNKEMNIPGGIITHAYHDWWEIGVYAIRAILGGAAIGIVGGFVSILLVTAFDSRLHEKNALLQFATTISTAYIIFYVAEGILEASGVIATVTAGMMFSEYSRGIIVSKETLDVGWETFGFIGNTLIFSLAGCICGKISFLESTLEYVSFSDITWIFLSWIFSFVSRIVMLVLLYPLLRLARRGESRSTILKKNPVKDTIVIAWGGLRGAVSLALGITVYNQNMGTDEEKNGTLLLLHVMGVAGLTLLINATTAAPLLKWIGMTKMPESHRLTVKRVAQKVTAEVHNYAEELVIKHNERKHEFDHLDVEKKDIQAFVSVIREDKTSKLSLLRKQSTEKLMQTNSESDINEIMNMDSGKVQVAVR